MARIKEVPKLNIIKFHYNGDQNKFEKVLSNMAADYLNSDKIPEFEYEIFVDNGEFFENPAIPLDKYKPL